MSRKQPATTLQKYVHRQGEGHVVDMMVVSENDSSITSRLDLSGLPVPDRRFMADAVGIKTDKSMIKLLFGQKQPVTEGLLSMVVVTMAFESVDQFLDSADEEFEKGFSQYEKSLPDEDLIEFTQKAEQTVILNSSVILAGYTGSMGCLDFYYASPFAMRQVAIFKKLTLEPIVRVNLPSKLLFGMLRSLREFRNSPAFPASKKSP